MRVGKKASEMLKVAKELGFVVEKTRKSHLKFSKSGCQTVFAANTPGDNRTVKNTISQLKRSSRGIPL